MQGEGCQSSDESDGEQQKPQNPIVDLEDMGPIMASSKDEPSEVREMVTPTIRKSLEKQGYKIIGSHSGVKLCRWTKVCLSCVGRVSQSTAVLSQPISSCVGLTNQLYNSEYESELKIRILCSGMI